MIEFEPAISPFFDANKNYCEGIQYHLHSLNAECSGFCNSYGYEIESTIKKDNLTYTIRFLKQQTENGITDANEYSGTYTTITGLNKNLKLSFGESSLIRLFTAKEFKAKVPAPYYIRFNIQPNEIFLENFLKTVYNNEISSLTLKNGKLNCKIHTAIHDPILLFDELNQFIIDVI